MIDLVVLSLAVALGYFLRGEWTRQRAYEASLKRIEEKVDAVAELFAETGSEDSDHRLLS